MLVLMHTHSFVCMHAVPGTFILSHTDADTQGSINNAKISLYRFTAMRLSRKEKSIVGFFVFDDLFKAHLLASFCSFFSRLHFLHAQIQIHRYHQIDSFVFGYIRQIELINQFNCK